MITVTQEEFEKYVHAATTCDETIYEAVKPSIEEAYNDIYYQFKPLTDEEMEEDTTLQDLIKRFCCVMGFQKQIRHLDLVLTDAGFGVVSNQNTAPASSERVNNLEKALLKEADKTKCDIYHHLINNTEWGKGTNARLVIVRILWDREEASELCGKADPGHSDWVSLQKKIFDAEYELINSIGAEVLTHIRLKMLANDLTAEEQSAMLKIRQTTAMLVGCKDDKQRKQLHRDIINYFDACKEHFPDYTNSREYKARHAEQFKNTQDSPAYFW